MSPRLDRYGDPIEDDEPETLTPAPTRKGYVRKGRPIGGLRQNIEAVGGKCAKCDRLICECCRVCGGHVRPGWTVHPSCERGAA